MKPFPEEDGFKIVQLHPGIFFLEFGSLLIEVKNALPFGFIQGGQCADQRAPFDHGKTGFRQAGNRADNHHGKDHKGACIEPSDYIFVFGGLQGHGLIYKVCLA